MMKLTYVEFKEKYYEPLSPETIVDLETFHGIKPDMIEEMLDALYHQEYERYIQQVNENGSE